MAAAGVKCAEIPRAPKNVMHLCGIVGIGEVSLDPYTGLQRSVSSVTPSTQAFKACQCSRIGDCLKLAQSYLLSTLLQEADEGQFHFSMVQLQERNTLRFKLLSRMQNQSLRAASKHATPCKETAACTKKWPRKHSWIQTSAVPQQPQATRCGPRRSVQDE